MEVILQEDVEGLGKTGEIVKVREGFARNFLLPRKKAMKADSGNVKAIEHQKKLAEERQTKLKKSAEELARKLESLPITIARESSDDNKLFGSVTAKDIAEALVREGVAVEKNKILLKEPLKQIGVFDVEVKLHSEVVGVVKVWVVKK